VDAILALEDGTFFRGAAAGAEGEARGEVVFNTSMTGYQEVLTDPSYAGQIVTMTCPEIGNYGVSAGDVESRAPQVAGFIIRDESPVASNWRSEMTLRDYLVANKIVAISDIDTRALTRQLRSGGVMRGVIATGGALDAAALVEQARAIPKMEGSDLVRGVTSQEAFDWPQEDPGEFGVTPDRLPARRLKIAAYDFGMKWNILRRLSAHGCDVRVYPATTPAAELLASAPDGIFLSNGPGDPAPDSRPRDGRQHVQAEIRPPRREPSGEAAVDGQNRNHVAEPRLRGGSAVAARRRRGDAPEPVRRDGGRTAPQDAAGVLRAVSSRGVARAARRRLPVRRFPRSDREALAISPCAISHQPSAISHQPSAISH
jgi:carbamoyl-phosphate synthase small subunit